MDTDDQMDKRRTEQDRYNGRIRDRLSSNRRDLEKPTTIWVVRVDDDLYARSAYGKTSAWFRGTRVRHAGRIRARGVERDLTFVDAASDLNDKIDAAYRTKYRQYPVCPVCLLPRSAERDDRFLCVRLDMPPCMSGCEVCKPHCGVNVRKCAISPCTGVPGST